MEHLHRSAGGCLCCGCKDLRAETTVVSPFLARRAWNGSPEVTRLIFCNRCGFRFFDRGLSDEEVSNYYRGYGNDNYAESRHRYEPFYTAGVRRELRDWATSGDRRSGLDKTLAKAGAPRAFRSALDFGGGSGHMLLDIDSPRKAVFDVDKTNVEPGIEGIVSPELLGRDWDLVLSCQVLEHLTSPLAALEQIKSLLAVGGCLYVEMPEELWTNRAFHSKARDLFLRGLLTSPFLLLTGDIVSTAFRKKLGVLPPFGFVPMREHLNYFTVDAISALMTRAGFKLLWSGRNDQNDVCAVALKSEV